MNEKPRRSYLSTLLLVAALISGLTGAYFYMSRPRTLTITWTTENELDIAGYNLYRAESAAADYQKINKTLILPLPDVMLGGEHSYDDDNVSGRRSYFYKLERIDRNGQSSWEGPLELKVP